MIITDVSATLRSLRPDPGRHERSAGSCHQRDTHIGTTG